MTTKRLGGKRGGETNKSKKYNGVIVTYGNLITSPSQIVR